MLIGTGKKTYNDPYLLYKHTEDEEKVKIDIKPSLRFNAKDYVDYSQSKNDTQDYASRQYDTLSIETPANVALFSVDDEVVSLKDNKHWRIESAVTFDDNQMKQYSMRPKKITRLTLKGVC